MREVNELAAQRRRRNQEELIELILGIQTGAGVMEAIPGLHLTHAVEQTDRVHAFSQPSFCVIAQGMKELFLGDGRHRYDADHYLLSTLEVPLTARVVEATKAKPYLAFRLELDPFMVGSVMIEAGSLLRKNHEDPKALVISSLPDDLLDASVRLVRLLSAGAESQVLIPLVKREIILRLLIGEQGGRLRHLPMHGGHSNRITEAVERLKKEFDRPLRIDHLAKDLGMSSSGFHHHFKSVTDMSPLQYQKQLRLQEARKLMLGQSLDAATAGLRVGYDDPSHFSRDYKKLFGNSPIKDVERLRVMAVAD